MGETGGRWSRVPWGCPGALRWLPNRASREGGWEIATPCPRAQNHNTRSKLAYAAVSFFLFFPFTLTAWQNIYWVIWSRRQPHRAVQTPRDSYFPGLHPGLPGPVCPSPSVCLSSSLILVSFLCPPTHGSLPRKVPVIQTPGGVAGVRHHKGERVPGELRDLVTCGMTLFYSDFLPD